MSKSPWGIGKQTLIAVVGAIFALGSVAWIGRILDEYKSVARLTKDVTKRLGSQFMSGWGFG